MANLRPNTPDGLTPKEKESSFLDILFGPQVMAPEQDPSMAVNYVAPPVASAPVEPVPVQRNPFLNAPQKSNLEQFNDLFKTSEEDLGNEEALLTKLKDDINRFEKGGSAKMDLTPLAAFADTFTGSNIASKISKPLSKEEREVTAMKLNGDLLERLQKVRGEKERRMDELRMKLLGLDNAREISRDKLAQDWQENQDRKLADTSKIPKTVENLDKRFNEDYNQFKNLGGAAEAERNLRALDEVSKNLGSQQLSGWVIGNLPDSALSVVNPEAIAAREAVEEVAQKNLKLILGAQFGEKEGLQFIRRAYNPKLPEDINKARVELTSKYMKKALNQKLEAIKWYEEKGTMKGYTGKEFNSIGDILSEDQLDKESKELVAKKKEIAELEAKKAGK